MEEADLSLPREEQEEMSPPQEAEAEAEEEDDDFFTGGDETEERIYPFDTESVSASTDETDYMQYLRDFTEKEEK